MKLPIPLPLMLCSALAAAQAPTHFSYQAVARDGSGEALASTTLGIRVELHQGAPAGPLVFAETHAAVTNDLGLFTLAVGSGAPVVGTLGAVDWAVGPWFLEVSMDPAGGTSYVSLGTQQLLSVPYALYAAETGSAAEDDDWTVVADTVHSGQRRVGIGTASPSAALDVAEDARVNGLRVGRGTGTSELNTALGLSALDSNTTGTQNTAVGAYVLGANTTGRYNTGTGYGALRSNTVGQGNTAQGLHALRVNTAGSWNATVGTSSMETNTTGTNNAAMGTGALFNNTTGSGNAAFGYRALYGNATADHSTALGYEALYSSDWPGLTAVGYQALYANTAGNNNSALGYRALKNNVNGWSNTAVGNQALTDNISGDKNTAMGAWSLYSNTGSNNTAFGCSALYWNVSGANNTAVGNSSLENNNGSNNVAVGFDALEANTTGSMNVGLGRYAGGPNTTGNENTYLGYLAGTTGSGFDFSTAIGANAMVTASWQVRMGTINTVSIGGYQLWTNLSDGRFKRNVQEDVHGLDLILKLRPVTYDLDREALLSTLYSDGEQAASLRERLAGSAHDRQTGLIAQEVEAAAREIGYDFNGVDAPKNADDLYGLRYAAFVVPLVKAVQEQQALIEELRAELHRLRQEVHAGTPSGIEAR